VEFRNRTTRAERIARWNAANAEGRSHAPKRLSGSEKARFTWIAALYASDLDPMSRLVGLVLAGHGNARGERIFPSVRKLAAETALSDRTVSDRLDELVKHGFLHRKSRGGDYAGARGFDYILSAPRSLLDAVERGSTPKHAGVERHATRPSGVARRAVGVERGASGVERGAVSVSNAVRSIHSSEPLSEQINNGAERDLSYDGPEKLR
jgi:hypothetical protein